MNEKLFIPLNATKSAGTNTTSPTERPNKSIELGKWIKRFFGISPQGDSNLTLNQQGDWVTVSQVGAYTSSEVDTLLGGKANTSEVATVLFKSITPTIITGKTEETSIYAIPLPTDGLNYIIEVSSRAQISMMSGSAISHRLRVGTYLSPIDGASGADAIGNQTVLGYKSESTGVGFPVTRRFKYFGGSTGSIFGMHASISTNDDNVSNTTSITLKSADLTTQHYLYVSFNPSVIGAIVTHLMLTIKLIKI